MIPGFEDSLGLFPYCLNVVIDSGKFHCIETRVSKCPKPKDAVGHYSLIWKRCRHCA